MPELRRFFVAASVIVALSCAGACGGPARERTAAREEDTSAQSEQHAVELSHLTMGTMLKVTAWTADEPRATAAIEAVFGDFDRLDNLLSVWKEGSDVLRLNAAAGQRPVQVSPETMEVLGIAREVSDETGGRFDITFGALTDVWRFDQDQDGTVPTASQILERLPFIDYKALVVDSAAGTAFLKRRGMRAHLGGIGKGYAVDRAVGILREHGVNDFTIQAGGDLYVGGRHGDRSWRLGIADPRAPDGPSFATIELENQTLSTSGDYERFFMKDGVRHHHILDPSTGQPARLCRSVTLVTSRAVIADALAKGVFILGPKDGMALIERLPDVEGVIVSSKNEVLVSSGLQGKLHVEHQPTDAP